MNYYRITFPLNPDGTRETISGKSAILSHQPGEGFIFAPFLDARDISRIPSSGDDLNDGDMLRWAIENELSAERAIMQPVKEEDHLMLVRDAVEFVTGMEALSGHPSKVVAARVAVAYTKKSPAALHASLTKAYPDACVFLFSTSTGGTWIGASPELLFSLTAPGGEFRSMALAGTRPAGTGGDWDAKNVEEQRMVTDFIVDTLRQCGLNPDVSMPFTRRAGSIEHICTDIRCRTASATPVNLGNEAAKIASVLSPTPALCGLPRSETRSFIRTHEQFDRQFYGGYIGHVSPEAARCYVNLRSGRLLPDTGMIILFAGGGITRHSNPQAEWRETERKLSTMLTIL